MRACKRRAPGPVAEDVDVQGSVRGKFGRGVDEGAEILSRHEPAGGGHAEGAGRVISCFDWMVLRREQRDDEAASCPRREVVFGRVKRLLTVRPDFIDAPRQRVQQVLVDPAQSSRLIALDVLERHASNRRERRPPRPVRSRLPA